MLKRLLRIFALAGLAFFLFAFGGLAWAHWDIRGLGGPLPSGEAVLALANQPDLPVRITAINTASQAGPRSSVLDPSRDPEPDARYVLGHASFVVEWQDGRHLLVDLGMEPAPALEFGGPFELIGAEPLIPHPGAIAEVGERVAEGPLGLLFSHLHTDHVQGVGALCRTRAAEGVDFFQTPAQANRHNYTTRPGVALLDEVSCLRAQKLEDAPLATVPGYPGVGVVHAAGHTPGSQIVLIAVQERWKRRLVALIGDVVNCADGARHDVAKPPLYSALIVPESGARLREIRSWLRGLEAEHGFELAPTHDQLALEALGLLTPETTAAPGS